jgi:urease accessory protein
MTSDALAGLLQFGDGLFPAGGHAHSFGLETYAQDGSVSSRDELQTFCRALLEGSVGPCDAVAVVAAMRAAAASDLEVALELDARLDALKPAQELRDASRQMGRQTLRVAMGLIQEPVLSALWDAIEARHTPGHHPLAFGFIGHFLECEPEAVATVYLYSTSAVVVNAALRLMSLGQVDGQRTLWSLRPTIARLAREAAQKQMDDAWSFAPGIEIAAMRHARLEARMFRS